MLSGDELNAEHIGRGLKQARKNLDKNAAEKIKIIADIDYWQTLCPHKEKVKVSHCGELATRCTLCGREW